MNVSCLFWRSSLRHGALFRGTLSFRLRCVFGRPALVRPCVMHVRKKEDVAFLFVHFVCSVSFFIRYVSCLACRVSCVWCPRCMCVVPGLASARRCSSIGLRYISRNLWLSDRLCLRAFASRLFLFPSLLTLPTWLLAPTPLRRLRLVRALRRWPSPRLGLFRPLLSLRLTTAALFGPVGMPRCSSALRL